MAPKADAVVVACMAVIVAVWRGGAPVGKPCGRSHDRGGGPGGALEQTEYINVQKYFVGEAMNTLFCQVMKFVWLVRKESIYVRSATAAPHVCHPPVLCCGRDRRRGQLFSMLRSDSAGVRKGWYGRCLAPPVSPLADKVTDGKRLPP